VAEALAHNVDRLTGGQQQRGVGVPQVMQADGGQAAVTEGLGAPGHVTDARQMYEPAAATVAALEAELAECERRAANIVQVVSDGADLTAQVEARSLRLAFEEEAGALRERIRMAREIAAPCVAANGETAAELGKARAALAELEEAVKAPFLTGMGPRTPQWPAYQVYTGFWFHDLTSARSRAILMKALKDSGLGAEIETRAIEAFRAGDPAALAVGGNTTRLADGNTVITSPGQPPVVYHGHATAAEVGRLPGLPMGDGRTAADVMVDAWGAILHQGASGLPGIHHGAHPPAR